MPESNSQTVLIRPGLLADGLGGSAKAGQAVFVRNGAIAAVGPLAQVEQQTPPDTPTVDLDGCCLTPGLIDGHTHLSLPGDGRRYDLTFLESDETMVLIGAMNMRKHLRAGITTLCEHGARNRVGFFLKQGLQRGYISGPRLLVSGRPITCTGGHFHMCNEIADGVEEIRRSVRRLVHEGADYIKVMASGGGTTGTIPGLASYSTEELQALVGEARQFHRLTVAHCRAKESMVRAVEAGIDLIEHVEFLEPDHVMRFDPKVAEMLAESGIWLSPTLQAWTNYPEMVRLRKLRDDAGRYECQGGDSARPSRTTSGEAARRDAADARLLSEGARGARHGFGSGHPRIRPLRLRPAATGRMRLYPSRSPRRGDPGFGRGGWYCR